MMMNYNTSEELNEFKKEFKTFFKKYMTLDKDFKVFDLLLKTDPCLESKHCNKIFCGSGIKVFKKRMQCRSLRDTLRVVYSYQEEKHLIEFIEIYRHVDSKSDYDHKRVKEYLKSVE